MDRGNKAERSSLTDFEAGLGELEGKSTGVAEPVSGVDHVERLPPKTVPETAPITADEPAGGIESHERNRGAGDKMSVKAVFEGRDLLEIQKGIEEIIARNSDEGAE